MNKTISPVAGSIFGWAVLPTRIAPSQSVLASVASRVASSRNTPASNLGGPGGDGLPRVAGVIGMAAITATVLNLASAGDHIVSSPSLYGGTYNQFKVLFPKFGVNTKFVGKATPEEEVKVARWAAVGGGVIAILGGMLAKDQNIAFLVALAFAVAASANLPTILYSLFWKRFNTRGALWSMYGGLGSALILIALSPVVSGSETAMLKSADFDIFPLANPGLVSIPLGFFLGWLGSVTSKEFNRAKYAEMEVRSLTGHGVAEVIDH